MLGKHKITVDTTTLANGDSLAAYLTSAAGVLLTHTTVGGKQALDVNVTNDITVDLDHTEDSVKVGDGTDFLAVNADGSINAVVTATNLDIRDLVHTTDSVKVGDGTDFLAIAADGSIAVTDNGGSLTVDATNLDIRDLTHVSDSVKIGDGTDFLAIAADGSIAVTDNGGSLTVDATNLDIRDLTAASDSVAAWTKDGSGNSITSQNSQLRVADFGNTAILQQQIAVLHTAATALPTSALANRKYLLVQNASAKSVWIGSSTVTTSGATAGIEVPKGSFLELEVGPSVTVYGIAETASSDCNILEMS